MSTIRLTVAQALVRFLARAVQRAGRGARSGSSPAASASSVTATSPGSARPCWRQEPAATPAGYCPTIWRATSRPWCTRRSATPGCATGARRWRAPPRSARRDQHGHRGGAGHRSTGCRCCCCLATSSPPGWPARCCRNSRTRGRTTCRSTTRSGRCRASSTASGGRSSCRRPCSARDARADRPGRDRGGDAGPPAGRAGARPSTGRRSCSRTRVWHCARPVPDRKRSSRALDVIRGAPPAADHRRRRGAVLGGHGRAAAAWPQRPASRSPRPRPARARCRGITRRRVGAIGCDRVRAGQRPGRRGRRRHRDRHPVQRLHHRVADRVRQPGGAVREPERRRVRRRQAGRPSVVADARRGLEALAAGLDGWPVEPDYTAQLPAPGGGMGHGVDAGLSPGASAAARADRGHRGGQRGRRRHADVVVCGGREPARRPAQAVARARDPKQLPRRVRLLLHGLRDRRLASASKMAAPDRRSVRRWSATART